MSLQGKVFKSFDEALRFRPEINFINHSEFNRLKKDYEIFYFYVYFDKLKVKYSAYYRTAIGDYNATETDSESGLDFQYDFYGGKNKFDYDIAENSTQIKIFIEDSPTLDGKVFYYPDVPSNLKVISREQFNQYGKVDGEFMIKYQKSNDFYNLNPFVTGTVQMIYKYYLTKTHIMATEISDNPCDSGYYIYSHYGTHNLEDMFTSERIEAKCLYVDPTINAIENTLEKGVKEVGHIFGAGVSGLFEGLGLENVLIIGGVLIVGAIVVVKVL